MHPQCFEEYETRQYHHLPRQPESGPKAQGGITGNIAGNEKDGMEGRSPEIGGRIGSEQVEKSWAWVETRARF
jgi:hypothetical protein